MPYSTCGKWPKRTTLFSLCNKKEHLTDNKSQADDVYHIQTSTLRPMKKTSTPKDTLTVRSSKTQQQPSASTIDFIRQFARAYSFEPQLPTSLGGFVNNWYKGGFLPTGTPPLSIGPTPSLSVWIGPAPDRQSITPPLSSSHFFVQQLFLKKLGCLFPFLFYKYYISTPIFLMECTIYDLKNLSIIEKKHKIDELQTFDMLFKRGIDFDIIQS